MPVKVAENHQVSPYFLVFIIYSIQVGIGILSYQRVLAETAGTDSWITILISGMVMLVILWMMFRLLERSEGDIIAIHKELLGKWLGGFLSIILCLYFLSMALVVLRTYTEIVQVWMFPRISYWQIGAVVAVTGYAFISGGFRSLTGIAFLSAIYGSPLFFTLFFPLSYAHYDNLLPMFQHSPWAIALSTQKMILNYEGFGLLLIFYPFIKRPKKAKKWAFYGIFITTYLYIIMMIIALVYYPKNQLNNVLWPTIDMWKIVDLPFMERFEYIGITIWFFVIMPNLCLTLWGATRGLKRLFQFNQRITAVVLFVIIYILGYFLNNRNTITEFNDLLSKFGFFFLCGYIPFLFILQTIVQKVKKRHVQA